MNAPVQERISQIMLISSLGVMGLFPVLVLPMFLGGLTVSLALPEIEAARICSAYLVGVAVGAAMTTLFGYLARPVYIARFGSLIFGLASFLCAFTPDYLGLLTLQFIAGFGAGTAVAIVVSVLARTSSPTRSYAIYTAMVFGVSSVGLLVSPYILMYFEVQGMFALAVILAVVGFIGSFGLASFSSTGNAYGGKFSFSFKGSALIALLAFFVFEVANGGAWAFMERLGASYDIAPTDIGLALMVSSLFGFTGALFALFVGEKFGRERPAYIAVTVLALAVVSLTLTPSYTVFFLSNALLGFFWAFTMPYFQSLLAAIDPSGKLSSAGLTVDMAALGAGPFIASFIVQDGLATVMLFSAAIYIVSGLFYSVSIASIKN